MKQTGMLVVSLREINFGFWSRLGCCGQSANILSCQGLTLGVTFKISDEHPRLFHIGVPPRE